MKLLQLRIDRLPGIQPGFGVEDIGPGINVITGPNASGKSSLMRALRACLYAGELRDSRLAVEAEFETLDGHHLRATRLGRELHWQSAGQNVEAPPLPEHHLLPCYTLHVEDLLASDNATDDNIAEQLRRELAGGYDIASIRAEAPFRVTAFRARTASQRFAEAERQLRERQRKQENLLRDEQRLDDLSQEQAGALEARRISDACQQALSLLAAQHKRMELETRLQDFPQHMSRLQGDEREQLDRFRDNQQQLQSEQKDLEWEARQAHSRLEESGLSGQSLQEADINDQRPELKALRELEHRIQQQREELGRVESALQDSITALGGEAERLPSLDPDSLHEVETQLTDKRQVDSELRELLAALERLPSPQELSSDPELLRLARRELLHWLAAPAPGDQPRQLRLALLLLGGSALAGSGIALWLHPSLTPVLLLPAAIGIYLGWRYWPRADRDRDLARSRYPTHSVEAPEHWQQDSVESRLETLDRELQQAERQKMDTARAGELRQLLGKRQEKQEKIDRELAALARDCGFNPQRLDASLERWLRLVNDFDHNRRREQDLRANLAQNETQAERLRENLQQFLEKYAEKTDKLSADALEHRLEQLMERIRQRQQAQADLRRIEQQQERKQQDLQRNEEAISKLLERAAIPDQDERILQERLDQLDEWKRLSRELDEHRSIERDRRRHLEQDPELLALVEAGDEATLLQQQEQADDRAEKRDGLLQEITRIRNDIERAGTERQLEAARARVQQARDELEDALEETLFAEAGAFLLDQVSQEHVRSSQPAALRQAADWFARFTRQQFRLHFSGEAETGFAAIDSSSGEQRRLSELSSGTRMQLLLAVRLAFALQAERGREPLPLILDETLTTTDPARFRAIAESLHTLAREGDRQIFYLSSQPGDIAYWREVDPKARVIDLPAIRQQAGAIQDPGHFELPAPETIPAPENDSAEQYASRLGVPAIDLWAEADNIPLFYLLRDDLSLLQRLLQAGISRVGHMRNLLEGDMTSLLLSTEEAGWLTRQVEAADRWLQARRRGHGRPVDRSVLEAAKAVSDRQLDRVDEQCREVNGDGAALIGRLEDGQVKRFLSSKIEELREWLEEQGHIDPEPPLSQTEVDQHVLSALTTSTDTSGETLIKAQALAASLENGLQR